MTNQTLPKFKSITSIPATKRNFVIKFIFLVMVLAFFGMLVMSVYYLTFEFSSLYIFSFLISGIICFGVVRFFRNNYPIHIRFLVDENGLHKIVTGKITETKTILYKDLINPKDAIKPKNTTYALLLKTEGRNRKVFEIYSLDKSNKIITSRDNFAGDIATNGIYRNHKKLVATYLLGVTTFRPDIKIDPLLFAYFFIDTETFEYNAKEQTKMYIEIFVFVAVILAIVTYYAFHKY
jgi:hypothetical protein